MKKNLAALCSILIMAGMLYPATVHAQTPPDVVTGYVGNYLELEEKYNIEITDIYDTDVYGYDGQCNKKGTTTVEYIDNDAEEDDDFYDYDEEESVNSFTVNVKYNNSLRMIGIEWVSTSKTMKIKLKNISAKNVTIYSDGAKYIAKSSSLSKTMKLSSGSKVTVKPGQIKTVSFKVKSGKIKYPSRMSRSGNWFRIKCGYNGKKSYVKLNLAPYTCNFYQYVSKKWKFIDTKCEDWDYWM